MKGLHILILGFVLLQSCEKYPLARVYRVQVLAGNTRHDGVRDTTVHTEDEPFARVQDKAVYVSAVSVPQTYNWRRDTSYGGVTCELLLFKNGDLVQSFKTGESAFISAAAQTHHLLGGHLYTEYINGQETVICRDGTEIIRYTGREILRGLLVAEDGVYTLGLDRDEGGFAYRKDGGVLIRQNNCTVFGDFNNSACGSTGALYYNDGSIFFCFRTASACYYVRDSQLNQASSPVGAARLLDFRVFGRDLYFVADYMNTKIVYAPKRNYILPALFPWTDASLLCVNGEVWVIAGSSGSGGTLCCRIEDLPSAGTGAVFPGSDNFIYPLEQSTYAVGYSRGNLRVQDSGGQILFARDSSYYFGRACAAGAGRDFYVLVTPREEGSPPFVWHGGKRDVYDINGYLTAIEVEISLPS